MAPKFALTALALVAMALAGCTAGSDSDGDSETSTSGGVGVGGTVSGPGGGVGGNATVSGSSTMTSTNSSTGGPEANETAAVSLEGGKFTPDTVTILVGGTVTWTHNDGANPHTVTSESAGFDSHPNCNPPLTALGDCMTTGETFEYTFTTAGEFAYHDKVNSGMTGTVRVVEA